MNESTLVVPLMDVPRQNAPLRAELDRAIGDCLDTCQFVQGRRVRAFEEAFAATVGAKYAVGCGNGTDALYLACKALGIGPGDEVVVPAMTFAATSEAVLLAGAKPVVVDVDRGTGLLQRSAASAALTGKTKAVIYVNLCGQSAGMNELSEWAADSGVHLIADAAQAHGARLDGQPIEAFAQITCYSFYPGKNLGACGDAGGCTTDDPALAENMAMRRDHGRSDKYRHEFPGVNMRMDELQGAVLGVKLPYLAEWTRRRQRLAARYHAALGGLTGLTLPLAEADSSVWHLYVVETAARDALRGHLTAHGIGSGIHYPIPLNRQPAFDVGVACPNAEAIARRALSLPMFESITDEQSDAVIGAVRDFFAQR
jgi:dTDP-4-amino-4,6-dideoxygalactose transaminase